MNKMDALNQQFVCRVCRVLNNCDIGLYNENEAMKVLHNIRIEYLDSMNDILEEKIDE